MLSPLVSWPGATPSAAIDGTKTPLERSSHEPGRLMVMVATGFAWRPAWHWICAPGRDAEPGDLWAGSADRGTRAARTHAAVEIRRGYHPRRFGPISSGGQIRR